MGGGTGFALDVGAAGALTVVAGVEWTEAPGAVVVPAFAPGVTVHSIISNVNPARRIKLLSIAGFKCPGLPAGGARLEIVARPSRITAANKKGEDLTPTSKASPCLCDGGFRDAGRRRSEALVTEPVAPCVIKEATQQQRPGRHEPNRAWLRGSRYGEWSVSEV